MTMKRNLEQALANADRLRIDLPHLHSPTVDSVDVVTLADTVLFLSNALQVIADPLAEIPKEAGKSIFKLIDYYETLAEETLKIVRGTYLEKD